MPTDPEEEPVYVQPSDQHSVLVFNPELMQEIEREIAAEPRGSDEVSSDSDGDHCDRLNEGNIFDFTSASNKIQLFKLKYIKIRKPLNSFQDCF